MQQRITRLALAAAADHAPAGHRLHGDGLRDAGRRPRSRPDRGPRQRPRAVGGPGVRIAAGVHRTGARPSRSSASRGPAEHQAEAQRLPGRHRRRPEEEPDPARAVGRSPVGGGDEAVSRIDDVLEKLQADIGAAKSKVDSRTRTTPRGSSPRSPTPRPSSARSTRPTRWPTSARRRGCRRPRQRRRTASSSPRRAPRRPTEPWPAALTPKVRAPASQLSLFSAGARPPQTADLAGLLCGPGQIVRFGSGDTARLSIVLPDRAAPRPCVATCAAVGIDAECVVTESGATAVRTAFRRDLVGARRRVDPRRGEDRARRNAARRRGVAGVDARGRSVGRPGRGVAARRPRPADPLPLVAAATRAGLSPARTGRGAALRITGARRIRRLAELLGPPPTTVAPDEWPGYGAGMTVDVAVTLPSVHAPRPRDETLRVRMKHGEYADRRGIVPALMGILAGRRAR